MRYAAIPIIAVALSGCGPIDQQIMDAAQKFRAKVCEQPEDTRQLIRNRLLELGIDTSKMCEEK